MPKREHTPEAARYAVSFDPDGLWFVFDAGQTARGGFSTRDVAWGWVRSLLFGVVAT